MSTLSRRSVLGAALAGAAAALPSTARAAAPGPPPTAPAAAGSGLSVDSWHLRWSPSAAADGLAAFETVEDDRAGSHPAGHPHIRTEGDAFRWDMHLVDRDSMTDRQRQEVTGMRTGPGSFLEWKPGQTWRAAYALFIPGSLRATTSFTHIMQLKQPGDGTSPILVQSLRRVSGTPTVELQLPVAGVLVGRTPLEPLHDRWIDVDLQVRVGDGTSGSVRWILRSAGAVVTDVTRTGVDTFLADRVRPKWGIYRSLGDTSGSLRDCHLLTTSMRGYQLVSGSSGVYRAEEARLSQGVLDTGHRGYTGAGFVNLSDAAGSHAEWTLHSAAAASATLTVRYANGTAAGRPMDVTVNGARAAAVSFPPTADWDTWAATSLPVALRAGTNTVRLTATGAAGGPNLDRIELR